MPRKKLSFYLFIIFTLILLSACGTINIDIKSNGSGKAVIELPNSGMISAEMVEKELKNESEDEDGISGLSVKDKKDIIEASFKFADIHDMDSSAYQIPVADLAVLNDQRLEGLEMDGEVVEFTKKNSEIFMRLPDDLDEFDTAQVKIAGKIVAHSEDLKLVNKNTVEVESYSTHYIVYEPKTGIGKVPVIGIVVLLLVGGLFYFRKNRKKDEENITKEVAGDEHA